MGTRSNVFVGLRGGKYIGATCLYDGYPEHMLEQLQHCTSEALYEHIIVAGAKGGFLFFCPKYDRTEYINDIPSYLYDFNNNEYSATYVYVMKCCGEITWKKLDETNWNTT